MYVSFSVFGVRPRPPSLAAQRQEKAPWGGHWDIRKADNFSLWLFLFLEDVMLSGM